MDSYPWKQLKRHFYTSRCLGLCILLLLAACGDSSPKQEIEEVLKKREQAIADKNLTAYMTLISPHYADKNENFQDIKKKAEANFAAFSKIELISSRRGIHVEGEKATVVQNYTLSYWLPSGKQSVRDKERLVLKKEKNNWKIIKGL